MFLKLTEYNRKYSYDFIDKVNLEKFISKYNLLLKDKRDTYELVLEPAAYARVEYITKETYIYTPSSEKTRFNTGLFVNYRKSPAYVDKLDGYIILSKDLLNPSSKKDKRRLVILKKVKQEKKNATCIRTLGGYKGSYETYHVVEDVERIDEALANSIIEFKE